MTKYEQIQTIFTITINSGPMSAGVKSALFFAKAAINLYPISQIFFLGDGVYSASSLITPMTDEFNSCYEWKHFHEVHHVPLNVCIASALRRGLINKDEAMNNNHQHYNIQPPFQLSGLGQLVKDFDSHHKIIQFGR